jgi:hypothetical protein
VRALEVVGARADSGVTVIVGSVAASTTRRSTLRAGASDYVATDRLDRELAPRVATASSRRTRRCAVASACSRARRVSRGARSGPGVGCGPALSERSRSASPCCFASRCSGSDRGGAGRGDDGEARGSRAHGLPPRSRSRRARDARRARSLRLRVGRAREDPCAESATKVRPVATIPREISSQSVVGNGRVAVESPVLRDAARKPPGRCTSRTSASVIASHHGVPAIGSVRLAAP